MTTPKSPEQIMEEFDRELHNFISPSNCDCCKKMGSGHNMAHLYSGEIRDFLRSSMASLLCYMAERMEMPCDDEVFYDKDGNSFSNPRTLLIEEARKITNNE